jgi:hypothetical protein
MSIEQDIEEELARLSVLELDNVTGGYTGSPGATPLVPDVTNSLPYHSPVAPKPAVPVSLAPSQRAERSEGIHAIDNLGHLA